MDRQILVPLDGSHASEAILATAIPIAYATGSYLTLLRVATVQGHVDPVLGILPADVLAGQQDDARQAAMGYLHDMACRFGRPGWPVQTAVLDGLPAPAILTYTAQHPEVGMIAMASHGHRGVIRWILGSVAEEVVHQAPVPTLLLRLPAGGAREGPESRFKTIIVPVDQSPFAEAAVAQATALAQATGARLVLETAVPQLDLVSVEGATVPAWRQRERRAQIDGLVLYQEQLAAQIREAGVPVGMHIADGRPADVILHLAAEINADLIVMATHGRTGFGRFRFGSVALEVAERATRPLLLVRVPAAPPDLATADARPAGRVAVGGAH